MASWNLQRNLRLQSYINPVFLPIHWLFLKSVFGTSSSYFCDLNIPSLYSLPWFLHTILYFPMPLIIYIYFYIFTFIFEFQTHLFNYFNVICLHCISKIHFSPSSLKTKYSIFSKTCPFFCFSNLKITLFNRYYDNKISDIAPDSSGNKKGREKISNKQNKLPSVSEWFVKKKN